MRIWLAVEIAFKNLRRHGRQSLATFVIMTVGLLATNVLYGYVIANLDLTKDAFTRWGARGHLMIEHPATSIGTVVEDSGEIPISGAEQDKVDRLLKADSRIAHYAKILKVSGMIANGRINFIFSGIGEEVDQIRAIKGPAYEYDVVAGKPLWLTPDSTAVVLGQGLARILGCTVPDVGFSPLRAGESPQLRSFTCPQERLQLSVLTESGQVNAKDLHPTGIMDWGIKDINDRLVVLPLGTAQSLMNTDAISGYHVALRDEAEMAATRRDLTNAFSRANLDLTVFSWSDRATFYHQVKGILVAFFVFIFVLAVVMSFASLLNASFMNIMGRQREIATLRSMGFTKRFVTLLLALENGNLAMFAGFMGVAASLAVTYGIRAAGWEWVPPGSSNAIPISVSWVPAMYVLSIAVLTVVAMLAAWVPAQRILQRPIRTALSDR